MMSAAIGTKACSKQKRGSAVGRIVIAECCSLFPLLLAAQKFV
jgi:hypothetical protein